MSRPATFAGLALAALAVAGPAFAEDPKTKSALALDDTTRARIEAQVTERVAVYRARLKLTPEQEAQVTPLLREERTRMRGVGDKYGIPKDPYERDRMRREASAIRNDVDARLVKVLSADQMKELKKLRAEDREMMQKRVSERTGKPRPQGVDPQAPKGD
jgi:hypothetical protein